VEIVGRTKNEIPIHLKKNIEVALAGLTLADQIVPLMFNIENLAILISLREAFQVKGLSFSQLGEVAGLGKSQKLVDMLRHLGDYGLVKRSTGIYVLTEYGKSVADIADRFLILVNKNPQFAQKSTFAGRKELVDSILEVNKKSVKNDASEAKDTGSEMRNKK
jgi:hypothetical protein